MAYSNHAIKIISHSHLAPGTMMVSPDIFELVKHQFGLVQEEPIAQIETQADYIAPAGNA